LVLDTFHGLEDVDESLLTPLQTEVDEQGDSVSQDALDVLWWLKQREGEAVFVKGM
jgi:hypothetical protein